MISKKISAETLWKLEDLIRQGRTAVKQAQRESRELGVPNVYSINGIVYFELSDGELSREDPYPSATKLSRSGKV